MGAGGYVLTKKMFVDRHAIVSLLIFFIFQTFEVSTKLKFCKFKEYGSMYIQMPYARHYKPCMYTFIPFLKAKNLFQRLPILCMVSVQERVINKSGL